MDIFLTTSSLLSILYVFMLLLLTNQLNIQYVVNEHFITKKGTRAKLSFIRQYLKYETDEQLSHMVF